VSTAADYGRFLEMLRRGGELDGVRILGRKSVELMTVNHLSSSVDYSRPGSGFGLGFNVTTDLGQTGQLGSVGTYGWGGAYHSTYWIDPKEGLVVSYVTQLIPAQAIDDHAKIRALIYQALTD
jgi:CubicO group peptidase (beta-lactamase class C family)